VNDWEPVGGSDLHKGFSMLRYHKKSIYLEYEQFMQMSDMRDKF
jgi:hypothetical protein